MHEFGPNEVTSLSVMSMSPVGDHMLERCAQVVVIGQHPVDPRPLVGTMQADRRRAPASSV